MLTYFAIIRFQSNKPDKWISTFVERHPLSIANERHWRVRCAKPQEEQEAIAGKILEGKAATEK